MLPTILSRRSLLALGAIALPVVGWAVFRLMRPSRVTSRIVVADSPTAASTLFYVAKEEGYFADEGIEIETVSANSGKEALDLIINGKAELCMAAEAPIVGAIMNGEEVQILATIQSNERNTAIIVPDQSSIVAPGDLRGHRVGYFPGTASQYFLTVFLNANSLSGADISAIVLSPKDAHEALARGDVDALSAWQEVRARADKLLGRRTRVMYADGVYLETWNLVGLAPYLSSHGAVAEGLVRALIKAQAFTSEHPDVAIDIVARNTDFSQQALVEMWPNFAFDVALDQTLLTNMEGHWRMAAKTSGAPETPPNVTTNLYPAALDAVDAGRVTFFR